MSQNLNTPSSTPSTSNLPSTASAVLSDGKDTMGHRLDQMTQQGSDAVHRFSNNAEQWAHQSADQLRHQGEAWRNRGSIQIQEHPLRSVAIAVGAGVLLAMAARLLLRR